MIPSLLDLCAGLPEWRCDAGQNVLEEGSRSGRLLVLKDGCVEVLKGKVPVSEVDLPGALFGEMSVLLDRPHTATVRALEPSVFAVVEDPEAFFQTHPDFARSVATLLARRLQGVTSYLADLKRQFAGEDSHLGMVDEVLDSLLHHPH